MNTKMIMKWAAAATLACITLTVSVRADQMFITGTLAKDATITSSDDQSHRITLNASGFTAETPNTMGAWEVGTGITLSLNLMYGTTTGESLTFTGQAFFNFGICSINKNQRVIYGALNNAGNYDQLEVRAGGYGDDPHSYSASGNTYLTGNGVQNTSIVNNTTYVSGVNYATSLTILKTDEHKYSVTLVNPNNVTITGVLDGTKFTANGSTLAIENMELTQFVIRQYVASSLPLTVSDLNIYTFTTVPEPSALFLLGAGVGLLAFLRRRKGI